MRGPTPFVQMRELKSFPEIAAYLTHPLVLIGLVLLLFFGTHRVLIKSGIIQPLEPKQSGKLLSSLLRYGFIVALVVIILGFALEFFKDDGPIPPPPIPPDIISPHISTLEALERIRSSYIDDLKNYELVDAIGSFYVFLKKPNLIYHRFPEWVFIFRNKDTHRLLKFKIADSQVPKIPKIAGDLWRRVESDGIAYYVRQKHSPTSRSKFKLKVSDSQGKCLTEWEGGISDDAIPEVMETSNTVVLARYQIHGGESEMVSSLIRIEDINKIGSIEIRKATLEANSFHSRLKPLHNKFINASKAIELALKKGAKATKPDKEGRGGSGIFRLFDGSREGEHINLLNGPYWDIPYRVGAMNPILVHAYSGEVYSLNKELKYTSNQGDWVTQEELIELQKKYNVNKKASRN